MLKTYKYILEWHLVENGKYSIIHVLSPTRTSLDNQKSKKKETIVFLKYTWMHIKYVINQHPCDKSKDYPQVDH